MRKTIYMLAAACAVMLGSCTNDDINISTVGQFHSVNLNINPQSAYDDFDNTSYVLDYLRDQTYAVGVYTYIYNEQGNLVESNTSHQYNLNPMAVDFNLLEGTYTVVVIEYLVDPDENFESVFWENSDTGILSTLKIDQLYPEVYFLHSIGLYTGQLHVGSSDQSVTINPHVIGSEIQLQFFYFDKSDYVRVGFATTDILESYRVDPSIDYKDRFVHNLSQSGYFNIRGQKAITSDRMGLTCYLLDYSIDYHLSFKKAENANNATWTTYNANTGTIRLDEGCTYYAGLAYQAPDKACKSYFGDLSGYRTWLNGLTPPADNTLLPQLCIEWGASVSKVQGQMNGYKMTVGSSGKAVKNGSIYEIQYEGQGRSESIIYDFKTATTGLFESDVLYSKNKVSISELKPYLDTAYIFLLEDEGSGTYMYCTSDFKTYVVLFPNGDYNVVGFVDVDYVNSSSSAPMSQIKAHMQSIVPAIDNSLSDDAILNIDARASSIGKCVMDLEKAILNK